MQRCTKFPREPACGVAVQHLSTLKFPLSAFLDLFGSGWKGQKGRKRNMDQMPCRDDGGDYQPLPSPLGRHKTAGVPFSPQGLTHFRAPPVEIPVPSIVLLRQGHPCEPHGGDSYHIRGESMLSRLLQGSGSRLGQHLPPPLVALTLANKLLPPLWLNCLTCEMGLLSCEDRKELTDRNS